MWKLLTWKSTPFAPELCLDFFTFGALKFRFFSLIRSKKVTNLETWTSNTLKKFHFFYSSIFPSKSQKFGLHCDTNSFFINLQVVLNVLLLYKHPNADLLFKKVWIFPHVSTAMNVAIYKTNFVTIITKYYWHRSRRPVQSINGISDQKTISR